MYKNFTIQVPLPQVINTKSLQKLLVQVGYLNNMLVEKTFNMYKGY